MNAARDQPGQASSRSSSAAPFGGGVVSSDEGMPAATSKSPAQGEPGRIIGVLDLLRLGQRPPPFSRQNATSGCTS